MSGTEEELPQSLRGLDPDFTGTLTSAEYLKQRWRWSFQGEPVACGMPLLLLIAAWSDDCLCGFPCLLWRVAAHAGAGRERLEHVIDEPDAPDRRPRWDRLLLALLYGLSLMVSASAALLLRPLFR